MDVIKITEKWDLLEVFLWILLVILLSPLWLYCQCRRLLEKVQGKDRLSTE